MQAQNADTDIEWEGVDWIKLAQDGEKCPSVVKMSVNLRAP
jgi:hypothetical protein